MTRNQLEFFAQQETKRSNYAREGETQRHNVVTERETNRHNLETERFSRDSLTKNLEMQRIQNNEISRSNKAREYETNRSNVANERIRQQSNAISSGNLRETSIHNRAMESNNLLSLTNQGKSLLETERANRQREDLQSVSLGETKRANLMNEAIKRENIQRDIALKQASLTEQQRHNRASEELTLTGAKLNVVNALIGSLGRIAGSGLIKSRGVKLK